MSLEVKLTGDDNDLTFRDVLVDASKDRDVRVQQIDRSLWWAGGEYFVDVSAGPQWTSYMTRKLRSLGGLEQDVLEAIEEVPDATADNVSFSQVSRSLVGSAQIRLPNYSVQLALGGTTVPDVDSGDAFYAALSVHWTVQPI